jgi:hypothetical protein
MANYFNGNNILQNLIPDVTLSRRIQEMLPAIKEILRKLKKESIEMINLSDTFDTYIDSKINKSNETNEQLFKMLKNPFGKNGTIINGKTNTDIILNFSELIQFETADVIKNILDLVDLSYDSLLKEVSKEEGKFEDRKFRYFLKTSYIPRQEHEEILANLEQELTSSINLQGKKQLRELEFINEDLKKENLRIRKELDEKKEELNRNSSNLSNMKSLTQLPIQELNNSILEKDQIINELRLRLDNQEKEINKLRQMNKEKTEKINAIIPYENEVKNLRNLNQSLNLKLQNVNPSFTNKLFEDLKTRVHELEIDAIQNKKDSEFEISKNHANLELLENKYKKEIFYLEEENQQLKDLNIKLRKDDLLNQIELKNKLLQTEIEEHKKDILDQQNKIKFLGDKYNKDFKNESEKLNLFYDNIVNGYKQNLENEKNNTKNAIKERDEINYKYLQAFSQQEEIKNNLNLMKDQHLHSIDLLKNQINDLIKSNEKLKIQFDEERKKLEENLLENSKFRKLNSDNEITIIELKSQIKKFENINSKENMEMNKKDYQTATNDITNLYEKKILILEDEKKNLLNKINQNSSFSNNEINKSLRNESMSSEKKQIYEERISELEHTVFELRSKIAEEELENKNYLAQNESLKLALSKQKDELYELKKQLDLIDSKNNEIIKEKNDIIQSLENNIKILKNKLSNNENNENLSNPGNNDINYNFEESDFIINELKHLNEVLIHEMDILKSEKENERKIMKSEITEKKELIDNLIINRDKTNALLEEERNKDKEYILKLEKEIRNFKVTPNIEKFDDTRINELEFLLLEEKNKNNTFDKELINAKNRIKELIENNEIHKKDILVLEGQLNDQKAFKKQFDFEYEIIRIRLESKEAILNNLQEEQKTKKFTDDKTISELNTKIKELNRRIEDLELENPNNIVEANNQEEEDLYSQLFEQKQLNAENLNIINTHENELFKTLDKLRLLKIENDDQIDLISKLKHENEELNMNKEEMKLYKDLYHEIKSDYDSKSAELELMKIKNSNGTDINLGSYKDLSKKIEILEDENQKKELKLQELFNENVILNNQINLNKIEQEENVKFRNFATNGNLRPNILINSIKARNPNHFYEEVKKSNYYLMDFEKNDYNGLLINRENWNNYLKNWLMPLREDLGGNLKLNLLYKATYHGFGQNEFKQRAK